MLAEPFDCCPVCECEAIWLPAGGVLCHEHGRFDEQGDALRERRRDAWCREAQRGSDALLYLSTGPL